MSTGGIGKDNDWTLTIVRTDLGREIISRMIADGSIIARPGDEDPGAIALVNKLAAKSRERWLATAVPSPGCWPGPKVRRRSLPASSLHWRTMSTSSWGWASGFSFSSASISMNRSNGISASIVSYVHWHTESDTAPPPVHESRKLARSRGCSRRCRTRWWSSGTPFPRRPVVVVAAELE